MSMQKTSEKEVYQSSVKQNFKTEKPKLADLKIIRSANVKYKVKNIKASTKDINNFIESLQGYISDLSFENNLYRKSTVFTIKIPQTKFNTVMDSIVKFADFIDYETITSKDVSEEFIDLETRLKTKIEVKKRYETILRKRAKTVKDILATEEKLRVIQEEIEAAQGRLKYLTNKVSLSTIKVNLYETVTYKEEPKSYTKTFFTKIKNSFSVGWEIVEIIFISLITIWPLLLIGLGILFYFKRKRN
jgi:hypothetical protein